MKIYDILERRLHGTHQNIIIPALQLQDGLSEGVVLQYGLGILGLQPLGRVQIPVDSDKHGASVGQSSSVSGHNTQLQIKILSHVGSWKLNYPYKCIVLIVDQVHV